MYDVMKAIYDSNIPIDFKGSMVLKACLIEANFHEEIRHTFDIDGNWCSDYPPTTEQMTDSLQNALKRADIDLVVNLYRTYGEKRSAGFEFSERETGNILFTMDIDVNRPNMQTRIYEISDICFRGVSVNQMLADKISSVSGDKIFRRIKDIVDLFYMSQVFLFHSADVKQILKDNGRELGTFQSFLYRKGELKNAYDKFRLTGNVYKPPFDNVYTTVKHYIKNILPKEKDEDLK